MVYIWTNFFKKYTKIHKNQSIFGLFGDTMGCTVYVQVQETIIYVLFDM